MNIMLEVLLKTRVKYLAIGIILLFCIFIFLSGMDHRVEEEQLGIIQYRKNILSREAEQFRNQRSQLQNKEQGPADFRVQFISGKELANEVDNEHKSFQVHRVKMVNMERSKITVECQDPFSYFGKVIPAGGTYEFRVTDLFAKRHYWCTGRYGSSEFMFKAYGEGAPRDNNHIMLHKEGAFINGKSMNMEDSPMKYKLPPKGTIERNVLGSNVIRHPYPAEHEQDVPLPDHPEERMVDHAEIDDPIPS